MEVYTSFNTCNEEDGSGITLASEKCQLFQKRGGLLSIASLALNGWDDFSNHGLISGGGRFIVDIMSTVAGMVIGGLTAGLPGGIVWGTTLSMGLNAAVFEPWKNSIN